MDNLYNFLRDLTFLCNAYKIHIDTSKAVELYESEEKMEYSHSIQYDATQEKVILEIK